MSRQFMRRSVQSRVVLPVLMLLAVLAADPGGNPPGPSAAGAPPPRAARDSAPTPPAERLAELQAIIGDPGRPAADRHAAAEEARRLRAEALAAAGPGDLNAPSWALDQAAAELAAVGARGADLAVLFGLPTDRQREAVARAATEAERLIRDAESRIERLLADAEGVGGGAPDDDRSEALRRLRDDEAGLRAPYYRGRAALLLAGVAREAGDLDAAAGHARAAIEAVTVTEAIDPIAETSRRITGAVAGLFAGERAAASEALHHIIRPGGAPPGADEIDASAHAEALFALAAVRAEVGDAEAAAEWLLAQLDARPFRRGGGDVADASGDEGGDGEGESTGDSEGGAHDLQSDPLLIVLAHDAAARLLIEAEEPDREGAVGLILRLLDREDLSLDLNQRRALVGARIDRLLDGAADSAEFAPRIIALRALHMARDPGRRAEAIALLRRAADQTDDSELREMARFEAAALLLAPAADDAERAAGVELLISMLQEQDDWPRAAEAAIAAAAHARALLAGDPADPGARSLLERALRAALGARPGGEAADGWRLDLARLLVSAPPLAPGDPRWRPADDRFAEALTLLEAIGAAGAAGAEARELAQALHLKSIEAARAADPQLAEAAARRALGWARRHHAPLEPRFRLELAEILLARDAGSEAKAHLLAITDGGAGLPGGRPRVRLNLARARLLTGGDAEAFDDLVDLAASLDAPPGTPSVPGGAPEAGAVREAARPDAFWEAWTLILEILQRQNEGGRRSQTILAHILRLRSIDPGLGAERWRQRIEAVEASLQP